MTITFRRAQAGFFSLEEKGFTLVEVLIAMAIFAVIMAGVYGAYFAQLNNTGREYKLAESEMELGIVKTIVERDIDLAGYGLADDYSGAAGFTLPRAVAASEGTPDTLTLMGTALGLDSRASQGWTYIMTTGAPPTFRFWGDVREDLKDGDRVVIMEPSTKSIQTDGGNWLYEYKGTNAFPITPPGASPGTNLSNVAVGTLAYGLHDSGAAAATQPYYAVTYGLGDTTTPSHPGAPVCAPGTSYLLRSESSTSSAPTLGDGDPLVACVLDFQVAFALDNNEDGLVDGYDNGGVTAAGLGTDVLRKRVKQVLLYLLVQSGGRDRDYTYPQATVRVGNAALPTGRDVALTAEQRRYRWKLVTLNVTLRNLR